MCAYTCACAALIPSPLEVAKAPRQDHVNANPETRDNGMRVAGVHLPSRLVLGEVDVQKLAVGDAGCVVASDAFPHRVRADHWIIPSRTGQAEDEPRMTWGTSLRANALLSNYVCCNPNNLFYIPYLKTARGSLSKRA